MPIQRAKIALNQISGGTPLTSVTSSDLPAGSTLQVVQRDQNALFSTTSTSFVDVTNYNVSITPSSTSSKILIILNPIINQAKKSNINAFFTILILVDVFILLISFQYTERYSQLIRNTGFIISTILLRLSFSATGLVSMILLVSGIIFGIIILAIYNQMEKQSIKV